MIESTVGAIAGDSVPSQSKPLSGFGVSTPVDVELWVSAAFRMPTELGFGLFTSMWVAASTDARFCATTSHEELAPLGNDVGEHVWESVTAPCRLKKATGMYTSFAPAAAASIVIDPKYCWLGASASPLIVIVSVLEFPDGRLKLEGCTVIVAPLGADVRTVNL